MTMRPRLAPLVALLAAAVLGVGLAACGGSDTPSGTIQGTITIGTDQVVTVSGGDTGEAPATSGGTDTAAASGGDAAAGKAVFTANCGGCHTLSDAGTSGAVGPNLDTVGDDEAAVKTQVENGGGAMPAFKGTLSDTDIANVAAYVAANDGG